MYDKIHYKLKKKRKKEKENKYHKETLKKKPSLMR